VSSRKCGYCYVLCSYCNSIGRLSAVVITRHSCCFTVTEFPAFLDYYRQLRDADPAYASKCNAHWRLFMQGPPNRPNKDDYGLINVVVQFFKSCDQGHY
jgi:hypothetical protein